MSQSNDAKSAAEATLGSALAFNSAVHSAFARVKSDLNANQFLLFDEINHSLQQDSGILHSDHIIESAAQEILEQMLMTEKSELAAKAYAVVSRCAELVSLPRENIPTRRLAEFLDDSLTVYSEMEVFLRWPNEDERKETAYHFAPAYNVVVSAHLVALAADGSGRSTMEGLIRDTLKANQQLVGTGETDEPGYLSDWVASQTPGSASAAKKLEQDPILFSIRRWIEEQQQALE